MLALSALEPVRGGGLLCVGHGIPGHFLLHLCAPLSELVVCELGAAHIQELLRVDLSGEDERSEFSVLGVLEIEADGAVFLLVGLAVAVKLDEHGVLYGVGDQLGVVLG